MIRWVAWPIVVIGLLLTVLVGGLIFLPSIYSPDRLRRRAERELTGMLGVPVGISGLEYDLLEGISIRGFRIGPPPQFSRDLFTAELVEVKWDLSELPSRRVTLSALRIEKPHFVLETRGDRTNLDIVLAAVAGPQRSESPPEAPGAPRTGPLSPVHAILQNVAVVDLGAELVGDGPNVAASGLGLRLSGALDPARLTAGLFVGFSKDARLSVTVPDPTGPNPTGPDPTGPATEVEARPLFTLSASVAADASSGLVLERISLALAVGAERLKLRGPLEAPVTDVLAELGLEANFPNDEVTLSPISVSIGGRRLVGAKLSVDGLSRVLADALGTKAGPLAMLLGTHKAGPGVMSLDLERSEWDLEELWPYAAPFLPGATASGSIFIGDGRVSGRLAELTGRSPRTLGLTIEGIELKLSWPERQISIDDLGFKLDAARSSAEYGVSLHVDGERLSFLDQHVGTLALGLESRVAALDPKELGATSATITLDLLDLGVPGARLGKLGLRARAAGLDVLDPERPENSPIVANLSLSAEGVSAKTGTTTAEVSSAKVDLWAELDRLLAPARKPIRARVDVGISDAKLPGLRLAGVSAHLGATTTDPRSGQPVTADVALIAALDSAAVRGLVTSRPHVSMSARAEGQTISCVGCAPEGWAPEKLSLSGFVEIPKIVIDQPSTGPFSTNAKLELRAELVDHARELVLQRLEASVGDLSVASRLRVTRPVRGPRLLRGRVELLPVELDKLVAMVPPAILAELPGLQASGTLGLLVELDGNVDRVAELASLPAEPPLSVEARIAMKNVAVSLPPRGVDVRAMTGTIAAEVSRRRTKLSSDLQIQEVTAEQGGARGVRVELGAGIEAGELGVEVSLDAVELGAAGVSGMKGASVDLAFRYPRNGEPMLERFEVRAPSSGLTTHATGRLRRGRFGVMRPELTFSSRVDFDRLKRVVGGLDALTGELGASLNLACPSDSLVDVSGSIEMHRLGYVDGPAQLVVAGVEGRLPFAQRLVLPPPLEPGELPKGALGDDLEARLLELTRTLSSGARVFVDPDDALAAGKRSADYEALRPFESKHAPRLTIDEIAYGREKLRAFSMDPSYRSGVFRLDRFAMQIWDGDIFGHMAAQITEQGKIRFGIRGSVTDLDLDVPYAAAYGEPRSEDPEVYRVSGILDLALDEVERTLGGNFELTKMSPQMVIRLLKVLDPEGANPSIQRSVGPLEAVLEVGALDILGERLSGVTVSIRQNLLSMSLHWDKILIGLAWGAVPQVWLPALRVLQAVAGGIANVFNQRFPLGIADVVPDIRRLPVSQVYPVWETLEQKLAGQRAQLEGRLTSTINQATDDSLRAETEGPR
ncbi:MAG: hypothetical protein HY791_21405 [Deltaproteobacteria bacterium]|nr:hypothetical protein [Deltaproteobacteria bacterium]